MSGQRFLTELSSATLHRTPRDDGAIFKSLGRIGASVAFGWPPLHKGMHVLLTQLFWAGICGELPRMAWEEAAATWDPCRLLLGQGCYGLYPTKARRENSGQVLSPAHRRAWPTDS